MLTAYEGVGGRLAETIIKVHTWMIKFSLNSWIAENDFFPACQHPAVELYLFNFFRFVEHIIWFKQSQQMKEDNPWFKLLSSLAVL